MIRGFFFRNFFSRKKWGKTKERPKPKPRPRGSSLRPEFLCFRFRSGCGGKSKVGQLLLTSVGSAGPRQSTLRAIKLFSLFLSLTLSVSLSLSLSNSFSIPRQLDSRLCAFDIRLGARQFYFSELFELLRAGKRSDEILEEDDPRSDMNRGPQAQQLRLRLF